jgi:hypothetical protein
VRVATTDIDITGVVPTLRGVFQKIDRARGEGVALIDKVGGAVGSVDDTAGNKGESLERAARAERARTRSGVVDEMSALQMEAAGTNIADLQRRVLMYWAAARGSNAVKLTVVAGSAPVPKTGVPKLKPVLKRAAGGVKLSAC